MILVISCITGVIAAVIAKSKGRSVIGWLFGGFLLGLIGVIIVAVLPNLNEQRARDEHIENENRRLREQLRQERLKSNAFRTHTMTRLDAHDEHLGLDTKGIAADNTDLSLLPDRSTATPAIATLQEMSSSDQWYYESDGEFNGPCSQDELIERMQLGLVRRDTLLWNKELADWTPAARLKKFQAHLPS